MKKLKDIISTNLDIDVFGIVDDSRLIKDNYIFVTTKGYNVDHYDYVEDAISKGCCFIVTDREIKNDFPHLVVDNIEDTYHEMCKKFYDINLDDFYLIGITGTDGKTTTATIVRNIIGNCAYIGTNGLIINEKTYTLSNTTPCVSELYWCFSMIKNSNISTVVMEVSSEALLHRRVDYLLFDIVAFTNITGDHYNVHKNFNNYLSSKLHLLDLVKDNGVVVVNSDDSNLCKINCQNMYTFGKNLSNDCVINTYNTVNNYTFISINYGGKEYVINSPLFGEYNVYNVVEAFLICKTFGIDDEIICLRIKELLPISGRGERLDFSQDYTIVLDYAHTINGIRSILNAYKNYPNIITVTGCAGGRDKSKRSIIGDMVIRHSTLAIFTMDDPRDEDVNKIIDEMVGDNTNYVRIVDRCSAIHYALSQATKDSVVLILGKGRDNYMAIEDRKDKYSDYESIKSYFV